MASYSSFFNEDGEPLMSGEDMRAEMAADAYDEPDMDAWDDYSDGWDDEDGEDYPDDEDEDWGYDQMEDAWLDGSYEE